MASMDDFFRRLQCSLHPQLRHYCFDSLRDTGHLNQQLDYWNLPDGFRRECERVFLPTGLTGLFALQDKCVFSFDTLSTPCREAVLLRNIFVLRQHRGQHVCTDALVQIVKVAEATSTCILAIVHPFEIDTTEAGVKAVAEVLCGTKEGMAYVGDVRLQNAMNSRLKKAGFRNVDMRDFMSDYGGSSIPLANQWVFVPQSVDPAFLRGIADRFVNENGYVEQSSGISTQCC
jgi:hypothetical protein